VNIPVRIATLKTLRRKEKNGYMHNAKQEVKVILQYDPHKRDKDLDALIELQSDINDFIDIMNIQLELPM